MLDWLRRKMFRKVVDHRSSEQRRFDALFADRRCPMCNAYPVKLYEGPSGGASTNIFCAGCGQGYNVTTMVGIAELISINPAYVDDPAVKAKLLLQREFDNERGAIRCD